MIKAGARGLITLSRSGTSVEPAEIQDLLNPRGYATIQLSV
jgi:hypothetical protein